MESQAGGTNKCSWIEVSGQWPASLLFALQLCLSLFSPTFQPLPTDQIRIQLLLAEDLAKVVTL
jgi:hypothetical protein